MLRLGVPSLLVAAAIVVSGIGASTAGAQALTVNCGSVITEDTTLSHNLRNCANGLVLAGSGITLDLHGHRISGLMSGTGLDVTAQDVTIKNGVVTGFDVGVLAAPRGFVGDEPVYSFHLQSLKVIGNDTGVSTDKLSPSLPALGGPVSSIESSTIKRNTRWGLLVHHVQLTVTDSSISRNGLDGVYQNEAAVLYERNNISNNGGDGIDTWSPNIYVTTNLVGNTLNGNGGSGYDYFQLYGDPFPRLENNRADRNGHFGFYLFGDTGGSWANLDGGGNSAKRNGDPRQCLVQNVYNAIPPDALVCSRTRAERRRSQPESLDFNLRCDSHHATARGLSDGLGWRILDSDAPQKRQWARLGTS